MSAMQNITSAQVKAIRQGFFSNYVEIVIFYTHSFPKEGEIFTMNMGNIFDYTFRVESIRIDPPTKTNRYIYLECATL